MWHAYKVKLQKTGSLIGVVMRLALCEELP